MESHVFVRPATPLDADAVGRIHARTMGREIEAATGVKLDDSVQKLVDPAAFSNAWLTAIATSPSPAHHVLSAVDNGKVVGFVALCPAEAADASEPDTSSTEDSASPETGGRRVVELTALEVDEESQRNGHGSRLLAAASDKAREQGANELQMWLLQGDDAHIQFFTSAGFAPSGLRRGIEIGDETVFQHCWHAQLV